MDTSSTAPTLDGRRKPRPGAEAQARNILEAAADLFLAEGTHSVSISQICQKADVSRPTFYRCFPDKSALLKHLYDISVFEPVESIMLATLQSGMTSEASIKEALSNLFETIFAQGKYAELVFRESNDPHSPAFEVVNQAFDNIVAAMLEMLPKQANPVFIKSIMVANQWIVHDAIRKGLSEKDKAEAKAAAWIIVNKLLS